MIEFNGQHYQTDKNGYLLELDVWSEDLAAHIAQLENIDMTEAHWEVVRFVRNFYLEFNTSPAMRALVKAMANKFGPDKGNSRYLYKLFPEGPAKQATKVAGLPKPVKCI
ncbi:TusE/DsrC/DsvC family sulfur relay protein [Agarivorans sp. TSD2052]|uniref:TusE/DsrC/DsvC family sulfur relay protein n=1 Tax=Agarivorans sp. TSD2052 TaxID=2937286 RepID=UPI00200BFBCD|nr:TusE/DsrC/DsvC family sulfur relay protein [Agarivorans sp. TSD2052]UPW20292.1 TusE/DsrC/DsvC family sulfur relay protein [Agarivorans sp. TSD2052]